MTCEQQGIILQSGRNRFEYYSDNSAVVLLFTGRVVASPLATTILGRLDKFTIDRIIFDRLLSICTSRLTAAALLWVTTCQTSVNTSFLRKMLGIHGGLYCAKTKPLFLEYLLSFSQVSNSLALRAANLLLRLPENRNAATLCLLTSRNDIVLFFGSGRFSRLYLWHCEGYSVLPAFLDRR